jgi:quinol-cytochrome oxidoreductase complex cytochrome b subunit
VASSPNLTRRILMVTLLTTLVVCLLSIIVPTPLEEPANPRVTPNPAKAPWYFLWLQELVTITTVRIGGFTINGALIGGIIVPGIIVAALALWPFYDRSPVASVGVWFARDRKRQNIVFLVFVLVVVVLTIIGTFLRGPYWELFWPWQTWPQTPTHF